MKNRVAVAITALSISMLFYMCRHEILDPGTPGNGGGTGGGGYTPPPTTNTCSPDTVYFVNVIQPLIASNCTTSGCHDVASHADGVNLTTYSNIMKYVKPGNGTGSKLYTVLNKSGGDRMPPPPKPALTTDQKNKILTWINQGAKNNYCSGGCDTAVFTYSGAVKNMMLTKCAGCHNPASLGGNIDLSTYAGTKVVADNGKLYGSVAHSAGFSAMPKNAAKLSDCEIRQIQKWIQSGSPNN